MISTEEFRLAQEIADSAAVMREAYAAVEWDCLDDNGKVWIAAIVREAFLFGRGGATHQPPTASDDYVPDEVDGYLGVDHGPDYFKKAAPTASVVDREAVARIIDPNIWALRDQDALRREEYEREIHFGWGETTFEDWSRRGLDKSLAKADAILALTARAEPDADVDGMPAAEEIRLLREALMIYGDRVRMATSCRPDLQQVIDRAGEATAKPPSYSVSTFYRRPPCEGADCG